MWMIKFKQTVYFGRKRSYLNLKMQIQYCSLKKLFV